ncbi:MAG: DUF58 domain-containing protein [Opitutales bacterium]|nr:DUF58 domain-containing protein [Opitutales bacterium]
MSEVPPVEREAGTPVPAERNAEWRDPGFFVRRRPLWSAVRLVVQLFKPPRGHRTLPTRAGAVLILLCLGIGTAAFNTSQNILYIALALLLSSLLLSGVLSWLNFKGCRWRLAVSGPFRAGESAPVAVEVHNAHRRLPLYSIAFEIDTHIGADKKVLHLRRGILPGDTVKLEWLWKPSRRGEEVVILRRLVSKFPFGFLRKSIEFPMEHPVLVWPAKIDAPLTFSRARAARPMGRLSHRAGYGADLRNLRDYRPGDPLRQIHWRATARQGRLTVREDFEETRHSYVVSLGGSARQWRLEAQFEKFCSFAATVVEDLYRAGRLQGVAFPRERARPVHNLGELHAVFDALARLQPQDCGPAGEEPRFATLLTFRPEGSESVLCLADGITVGQA